jgi:hypothetical protein
LCVFYHALSNITGDFNRNTLNFKPIQSCQWELRRLWRKYMECEPELSSAMNFPVAQGIAGACDSYVAPPTQPDRHGSRKTVRGLKALVSVSRSAGASGWLRLPWLA